MKAEEAQKILIVEDDYHLASEWQTELKNKGYHVDAVYSSTEAELLLKNNYDYYILDLFHVKNNKVYSDGGLKCIGKIRRHERSIKNKSCIIAVTGFYREEKDSIVSTKEVVTNLGADFVFKKPITISKILETLKLY